MAGKVRVDIDELIGKLNEMKDDGFVTAELEVIEGDYELENELSLAVIDIENDDTISYGRLSNVADSL